jgi:GNAT superfamily N-acetyltransferase
MAGINFCDRRQKRPQSSRQPPVRIFVASLAEEALAYAAFTLDYSLWRARKWAHLDCLYVQREARGKGIGSMLLRHVADESLRLAADRLEWQTPDWNDKAIAFYSREGATACEDAVQSRLVNGN